MFVLLSHRLTVSTPVYPGSSQLVIEGLKSIARGDSSNSFVFKMGNHVGTHVDAPRHFDDSGRAIADFSIEELVFNYALIIDLPKESGELITREDLQKFSYEISACSMLLIRTGFQKYRDVDRVRFAERGPCMSRDAARYLAGFYPRLRAIGIDTISLGSPIMREEGREAHRSLLVGRDFLIIEDMDLAGKPKSYSRVIVAPLMIIGIDSAPCMVIGEVT